MRDTRINTRRDSGKASRTTPVQPRPFMTIRDQVAVTGLSEKYVRKLLKDGELPHVMSGSRCLVNVPLLIEMMNKKSQVENMA